MFIGDELKIFDNNSDEQQMIDDDVEYEKQRQKRIDEAHKEAFSSLISEIKKEKFERIKNMSLLSKRYANALFDNVYEDKSEDLEILFNRCKKYCEVANKCLEQGLGIYIYGDCGTGKTYISACMANELISKGYVVLFTSCMQIISWIKSSYGKNKIYDETEIIERVKDCDFLFIDDLGSEFLSKNGVDTFNQEKIYQIINTRYNENKPTIFTSNYSIDELVDKGLPDKTIDRIYEMSSAIIKINGESLRRKKVNDG